MPSQSPRCRTLSESRSSALLSKLRGAQTLVAEDYTDLHDLLESFAYLREMVASPAITIAKVRRTLGLPGSRRASAKPTAVERDNEDKIPTTAATPPAADRDIDNTDETPPSDTRDKHGRRKASDFSNLLNAHHQHPSMRKGDECPGCVRGRLYDREPSCFTSIAGQSPLQATRHTVDALQCNRCKKVYKAPLPEVVENDGVNGRVLYSYSAIAYCSIYRFFGGMPMHRQGALQKMLGVEIPDASIWDMCEKLANVLRPVRRAMVRQAADAKIFYGDDTGATILDTRSAVRTDRRTGKPTLRTGCHTTCVIAVTIDNQAIILFETGIHHTGEVMDVILESRDPTLSPAIFMGDGIASNTVNQTAVLYAGCNAHAVRRFKALVDSYPEYTDYVLSRYKEIYDNDAEYTELGLNDEERCKRHKAESRPLLREITEHGESLKELRKIEPNSDIGEAFNYVVENERRLAAFARNPGAPIDNNRCERQIRTCVRLREVSHFFRNAVGATVADIILSVGATAAGCNLNLVDYFTAVQRFSDDVVQNPELWLPWAYRARMKQLTGADPPEFRALKLPAFSEGQL